MVTKEYPFYKLGELLPSSYKNGIYKSADSYGKGTSILRINDFDNYGNLISENLLKVDLTPEEKESYKLGYNDIVVNRVNSLTHIGKSILWKHSNEIAVVYESNMMRIQPNESILYPDYLIKILQSENARNFFKKVAKQAVAQCSINQQDVKSLPIPLPPLPEQKKIAEILSTWDKAIETVEKLVANSQQQKKALMQQLLTAQKRLLDENGVKFGGEWGKGKLSDLANISKGKALSSKNIKSGNYPVIAGGKTSPYCHNDFTHENVVTVSASGAYAGYVAYHSSKIWASDCSVITEKGNSDIKFIFQLLSYLQSTIYSLQSGGAQPHVYPKDLEIIEVGIPSKKEQKKIAQVLMLADREIDLYQQQLDKLKLEKKSLMQQLLTGQKRVKLDT